MDIDVIQKEVQNYLNVDFSAVEEAIACRKRNTAWKALLDAVGLSVTGNKPGLGAPNICKTIPIQYTINT